MAVLLLVESGMGWAVVTSLCHGVVLDLVRGAVRGVTLHLRTPWVRRVVDAHQDPAVRWVVVLLCPRGVCAWCVHVLSGQIYLMCQPPLVLFVPGWSRPEVVKAAACCMVGGREWSRQATDVGPWPAGPPEALHRPRRWAQWVSAPDNMNYLYDIV